MYIEREMSIHAASNALHDWLQSDRRRAAIAFAQACEMCSNPSSHAAAKWVESKDREAMARVNSAYVLHETRRNTRKEGSADAALEAVMSKIESGAIELPFPFLGDTSPSAEFL